MAWGRRCDLGCESWPDEIIYKRCPECGEETTRFSNLRPIPQDEARSIIRHKAFEVFYANWCREHEQPVEGDLPYIEQSLEDELSDLCSRA